MARSYFQVIGATPFVVDHADGRSVAYRPRTIFAESPLNASVARGLRTRLLRMVSEREAASLDAMRAAKAAQAAPAARPQPPRPPEPPKPPVAVDTAPADGE